MKIACASTLDDNYFKGFVTFFYSLLKHTPSFNYDYYIFDWGQLSEVNKQKLLSIYPFIIKQINNKEYEGATYITRWRNWTINCINRFEVFTLADYDKVIFFDVDMLVVGSIDYLFEVEIEFGGVEIVKGAEMDHPGKYDPTIKSFNGGLFIISKKYLNEETRRALIELGLKKAWTGDEPILNTYFDNSKVTFLPKMYNIQTPELTLDGFNTAKIIHFLSVKKPWMPGTFNDRYDDFVIAGIKNLPLLLKLDNTYQRYYNEAIKAYDI
jgi:lipopolysaccharide biosynthesis glycosyltransferase